MIPGARIEPLNAAAERPGRYVLYWMQASQRAECNHALEFTVREANSLGLLPIVYFGLTDRFPDANLRHYAFLLEGLAETRAALEKRGIKMALWLSSPPKGAAALAKDAAMVIVDRGYLRVQKQWRRAAAAKIRCPLIQVESDVVVPVEQASEKEEYAARTIPTQDHEEVRRIPGAASQGTPQEGFPWAAHRV